MADRRGCEIGRGRIRAGSVDRRDDVARGVRDVRQASLGGWGRGKDVEGRGESGRAVSGTIVGGWEGEAGGRGEGGGE